MRCPLLLVPLFTLVGCGHYGERHQEELTGEVALPPDAGTVRIQLPGGSLTVEDGPPGRVAYKMLVLRAADTAEQLEVLRRIDLRPRPATIEPAVLDLVVGALPEGVDERQNRLVCRTILQVPADVAVVGTTAIGPVAAVGRQAAVTLKTGSGLIRFDSCSGVCTARAEHGDVVVSAHRGGLDVETGQGMMQVWVDAIGDKDLRLTSRQGSIQVHVPRDASFSLDARAEIPALKVADKVRNSFGIPLQASGEIGAVMRGEVGTGGPSIVIQAFRGRASVGARD